MILHGLGPVSNPRTSLTHYQAINRTITHRDGCASCDLRWRGEFFEGVAHKTHSRADPFRPNRFPPWWCTRASSTHSLQRIGVIKTHVRSWHRADNADAEHVRF